jgi:hypothetical protein
MILHFFCTLVIVQRTFLNWRHISNLLSKQVPIFKSFTANTTPTLQLHFSTFKTAFLSQHPTKFNFSLLSHQRKRSSDLNKSSALAHRYHTGKNRKSKFTINVLFQSSSYRFFPNTKLFQNKLPLLLMIMF